MTFVPRVVDCYHGDVVGGSGPALRGFQRAADAGIWGVIHKATQGTGYKDRLYDYRRLAARAAGLLWGAYHFNSGAEPAQQVDWFMHCADPDENTLMVLDYEDNVRSQMSPYEMVEFLRIIEGKLGRKAALYSGNRIKETIHHLSDSDRAYVCSHKLWLCQYGSHATLPPGWNKYWLWQYTGDGIGPSPHSVPGITVPGGHGIDLNVYDGTREQLTAEWSA